MPDTVGVILNVVKNLGHNSLKDDARVNCFYKSTLESPKYRWFVFFYLTFPFSVLPRRDADENCEKQTFI